MSRPARGEVRSPCPWSSVTAARWRWRVTALLLLGVVMSFGCGPELLYFLWPQDDKVPPRCKLMETKKDPTVVILVSHGSEQTKTSELFDVDRQLADQLTQMLEQQYKENNEKVTIVPSFKVREYKAKNYDWETKSTVEIGKHFGADYVINLEIGKMTLFKERSMRSLFEGHAEIHVMVTNVNAPRGSGPLFSDYYRTQFPPHGEEPADYSAAIFRAHFVQSMAHHLATWFAAHPNEAKSNFRSAL